MAKQLVNPVERHVEKAVLAVAGLLLIGVIARYLVTSPNQLSLGGESVTTPMIDETLGKKAAAIRERIKNARAPIEMPEPAFDDFVAQLDPFKRDRLSLTVPGRVSLGPEVPLIDPGQSPLNEADPVKVMATEKPAVTTGRSTLLVKDAGGSFIHRVANWVTVSALFKVKEQMAEQENKYGATRKSVVFGLAELQRRARRDDGGWRDEDWVTVQPWAMASSAISPAPPIDLVQSGDGIALLEGQRDPLNRFSELLSDSKKQRDIIRPRLPDVANGSKWMFPVITSVPDVLMEDDYYLNPTSPPSANPVNIYEAVEEKVATHTPTEKPPKGNRVAQELQEVERIIKTAYDTLSVPEATRAYSLALELSKAKDASATEKTKALKLKQQAEQAITDITRKLQEKPTTVPDPNKGPTAPEGGKQREPLPVQQIWVHDAEPDSVQSGRTYQYRLRPVIYNRLAGEPGRFRDPNNAQVVWIAGPWTDPLEVTVEPSTLFFATLEKQPSGTVSIEFFQWFEGVWVKTREDFRPGQALSVETRCQVPPLEKGKAFELALVTFNGNATIVDIDYARAYRERKRGTGRTGVKLGPAGTGCSVVFVDASGRLQERFVPTDKGNPDKTAAGSRVWTPPKKEK